MSHLEYYNRNQFINPRSINLKEMTQRAEAGDPSALFLGAYITNGGYERKDPASGELIPVDYETSYAWAEQGADAGDTLCKTWVGLMLCMGVGCPRNDDKGTFYLNDSLEQLKILAGNENPYALTLLGLLHEGGFAGLLRSHSDALRLYKRAAEKGEYNGISNAARLYFEGQGVPRSLKTAKELYESIAFKGHAGAQHSLGLIYATHKEPKVARQWWQRSADQGVLVSRLRLAEWYSGEHGNLTDRDLKKAFAFYSAIADEGDFRGEIKVVDCHMKGAGVERDRFHALNLCFLLLERGIVKSAAEGEAQEQPAEPVGAYIGGKPYIDIMHRVRALWRSAKRATDPELGTGWKFEDGPGRGDVLWDALGKLRNVNAKPEQFGIKW